MWQVGAFVSPYAFGLAKDSTGGFTVGLIGSAVVGGAEALLILYVRARVASDRRARVLIATEPVAVPP